MTTDLETKLAEQIRLNKELKKKQRKIVDGIKYVEARIQKLLEEDNENRA